MKKTTFYLSLGILLLINTGMFFYFQQTKQKAYYVDLQKLYEAFELKRELETTLANYTHSSNNELDSLALTIEQLKYNLSSKSTERDIMLYEQLNEVYDAKEKSFTQEKTNMASEFDDQIWKQLNQYIRDYAQERDCDFVLGGNGDGSVMYAKSSKDITEEMIVYVNNQYNGANEN